MNDTFTDETQLDIDSSFTDSPPAEEPSTDIVEILPNGDEPVITPPVVQITATPVSYTHLDVYKRQVKG